VIEVRDTRTWTEVVRLDTGQRSQPGNLLFSQDNHHLLISDYRGEPLAVIDLQKKTAAELTKADLKEIRQHHRPAGFFSNELLFTTDPKRKIFYWRNGDLFERRSTVDGKRSASLDLPRLLPGIENSAVDLSTGDLIFLNNEGTFLRWHPKDFR
ncbi:MAG: hypothetical protein AAF514_20925, partial [Verrucomicrobiota bacterium]